MNRKCFQYLYLNNALLTCSSAFVATTDNQFSFKGQYGAETCVVFLKYDVCCYVIKRITGISAFLDASKVFHRNNHSVLLKKLINTHILMRIVRMLVSWYRNRTKQIKWGTCLPDSFIEVHCEKYGCESTKVWWWCCSCVFFPIVGGLQSLLKIWCDCVPEHKVILTATR